MCSPPSPVPAAPSASARRSADRFAVVALVPLRQRAVRGARADRCGRAVAESTTRDRRSHRHPRQRSRRRRFGRACRRSSTASTDGWLAAQTSRCSQPASHCWCLRDGRARSSPAIGAAVSHRRSSAWQRVPRSRHRRHRRIRHVPADDLLLADVLEYSPLRRVLRSCRSWLRRACAVWSAIGSCRASAAGRRPSSMLSRPGGPVLAARAVVGLRGSCGARSPALRSGDERGARPRLQSGPAAPRDNAGWHRPWSTAATRSRSIGAHAQHRRGRAAVATCTYTYTHTTSYPVGTTAHGDAVSFAVLAVIFAQDVRPRSCSRAAPLSSSGVGRRPRSHCRESHGVAARALAAGNPVTRCARCLMTSLARWCYGHAVLVLVLWILVVAVLVGITKK